MKGDNMQRELIYSLGEKAKTLILLNTFEEYENGEKNTIV